MKIQNGNVWQDAFTPATAESLAKVTISRSGIVLTEGKDLTTVAWKTAIGHYGAEHLAKTREARTRATRGQNAADSWLPTQGYVRKGPWIRQPAGDGLTYTAPVTKGA